MKLGDVLDKEREKRRGSTQPVEEVHPPDMMYIHDATETKVEVT